MRQLARPQPALGSWVHAIAFFVYNTHLHGYFFQELACRFNLAEFLDIAAKEFDVSAARDRSNTTMTTVGEKKIP
jgi:hypothetical protein